MLVRSAPQMAELLEYNSAMGRQELLEVNPDMWNNWLWFVDAREELNSHVLLNEFHLTGLVLCRMSAMQLRMHPEAQNLCCCTFEDMHVYTATLLGSFSLDQKKYANLSMREVKNHLQQTQMHIYDMCDTSVKNTKIHVAALFTRLGQLLLYNLTEVAEMYDDINELQPEISNKVSNTGQSRIFTESSVRWYMNIFYILFRNLHLFEKAKKSNACSNLAVLQIFHVEATLDVFYEQTMRWDLPPGAVLCYQHEFVGMFNSISQVLYYNYPEYERRKQLPWKLVSSGDHAIYSLAPLLSLYPDVELVHEDAPLNCVPGNEEVSDLVTNWRLLLLPGFLYLLSPTGEVFHHKNVCELLRTIPNTAEV